MIIAAYWHNILIVGAIANRELAWIKIFATN